MHNFSENWEREQLQSMKKSQVCTHGHPPLVCGCNELIRKGRSSTRKHCPAKPTVLGNLPIFIQHIFLNHYWCQGVDMQAFLGNTNLLWHFTIFTHFYPTYLSIAGLCPLSLLDIFTRFCLFCNSAYLLEMGEVGYANLTSKNFSLLNHLASAIIV